MGCLYSMEWNMDWNVEWSVEWIDGKVKCVQLSRSPVKESVIIVKGGAMGLQPHHIYRHFIINDFMCSSINLLHPIYHHSPIVFSFREEGQKIIDCITASSKINFS